MFLSILLTSSFITLMTIQFIPSCSQKCQQNSRSGYILLNNTFEVIQPETFFGCFMACLHHPRCMSINYVIFQQLCQINDVTKEEVLTSLYQENMESLYAKIKPHRFEFCSKNPLGMENGKIKADQLLASSRFSHYFKRLDLGRLNWNGSTPGYQTNTSDPNPWFKIDLLNPTKVYAVAIQGYGKRNIKEWTTAIAVQYSLDGITWKMYQEVPGIDKIFPANNDQNTVVKVHLKHHIVAKEVKILAKTCMNVCSFRLELYGCDIN